MNKILKLCFEELGVKEIPGEDDNARILNYAKESGISGISDDETPWCSIFTNWVAYKLGLERTDKPNARSWVNVGESISAPSPGDVVVFWRESRTSWKGHVAFFLGYSSDLSKVFCIGGNQGNAVSVASYDSSKVLQFRRLDDEANEFGIPNPVLKMGSRGEEVEKLQNILNLRGYPVGDADGIFGQKTVSALKVFQADNKLTVDGVYGGKSKTVIESLLQS